ncbi:I-set domain containing protein, partial [Asbolus verrucosus]
MDTVTLQCKYNLQGEPLYTVKWYKGGQEFFRYIPKELPSTQVFALPGITVD